MATCKIIIVYESNYVNIRGVAKWLLPPSGETGRDIHHERTGSWMKWVTLRTFEVLMIPSCNVQWLEKTRVEIETLATDLKKPRLVAFITFPFVALSGFEECSLLFLCFNFFSGGVWCTTGIQVP